MLKQCGIAARIRGEVEDSNDIRQVPPPNFDFYNYG